MFWVSGGATVGRGDVGVRTEKGPYVAGEDDVRAWRDR